MLPTYDVPSPAVAARRSDMAVAVSFHPESMNAAPYDEIIKRLDAAVQ
jgi:hypothetical protein